MLSSSWSFSTSRPIGLPLSRPPAGSRPGPLVSPCCLAITRNMRWPIEPLDSWPGQTYGRVITVGNIPNISPQFSLDLSMVNSILKIRIGKICEGWFSGSGFFLSRHLFCLSGPCHISPAKSTDRVKMFAGSLWFFHTLAILLLHNMTSQLLSHVYMTS